MRGLLGLAVALMVVMPAVAFAQSPERPIVELGAQGSKKIGDKAPVAWSLRLTVPLKPRIAIEAAADIQKSYVNEEFGARTSAREFSVHWRQTVFTSGRWRIFGLLGVGRHREERSYEHIGLPITFVVSHFVAHIGPAVQVELAPWLALRGDLRGTIGNNGRNSGVRGMVGAVIPIGRSRASDPPSAPAPAPATPNAKPKTSGSTPPPAAGQPVEPGREVSPRQPIVELGAQSSKRIRDEGQSWSLRLTAPVKRRTAIEGTANIQKSYLNFGQNARISAMEFSVHWRQTVFTSGSVQVFGVLGGGRNRVVHNVPERIAQGGIVEPPFTFVSSEFVAHFGPAVQVELAPWLALRGDVRGTLGERDSGVNVMVGAVIPIGRSRASDPPAESTPPSTLPSTPPPAAWQRVKRGREVWVTTNTGSLVHGEIAAISDSNLSIREQGRDVTLRLDDVRLVEGRDSKKNGFLIGAVFGAVAGGALGSDFWSNCGSDCGTDDQERALRQLAIAVGAVGGGIVGGLLGLMVDGLIPGRQTLFRGSTTVVTPVITPTRKAIDVAIRWR